MRLTGKRGAFVTVAVTAAALAVGGLVFNSGVRR